MILEKLNAFVAVLSEILKATDYVRTDLGDFIARSELPAVGRNPRTGEEIRVEGKYFYYLLPSPDFLESVFKLSGSDLASCVMDNRLATLGRLAQRFGEIEIPASPSSVQSDPGLIDQISAALRAGSLEISHLENLISGQLKVSRDHKLIIFSAVGQL